MSLKNAFNPYELETLFNKLYRISTNSKLFRNLFRNLEKEKFSFDFCNEIYFSDFSLISYEKYVIYNILTKNSFEKVFGNDYQKEMSKYNMKFLYFLEKNLSKIYTIVGTIYTKPKNTVVGYYVYSYYGKVIDINAEQLKKFWFMEIDNSEIKKICKDFENSKNFVDDVFIVPAVYVSDETKFFGKNDIGIHYEHTEIDSATKDSLEKMILDFGRKRFSDNLKKMKKAARKSHTTNSIAYPVWINDEYTFLDSLPMKYKEEIDRTLFYIIKKNVDKINENKESQFLILPPNDGKTPTIH